MDSWICDIKIQFYPFQYLFHDQCHRSNMTM